MFKRNVSLLLVSCAALLVLCAPSSAFASGPQWTVTAYSAPTNLAPGSGAGGEEDLYRVDVQNTGGAPSDGETVTVSDLLPAGLTPAAVPASGVELESVTDTEEAKKASCVGLTCTYSGVVGVDNILELKIPVEVAAGPFTDSCALPAGAVGCVTNRVTVSGGGAPQASRETPTVVSSTSAAFGIAAGSTATALFDQSGRCAPRLDLDVEVQQRQLEAERG